MTQSKELTEFYNAYAKWLDDGAIEGKPFTRGYGLCTNLEDFYFDSERPYRNNICRELVTQFVTANLNSLCPFNLAGTYSYECSHDLIHLNHYRIQWVRDHLNG
jgi:hypothetical protein